jgi:hypothetical protein
LQPHFGFLCSKEVTLPGNEPNYGSQSGDPITPAITSESSRRTPLIGVVLLGAALWGPIVSNVEYPKYKVVERSGNIEIRDYAPMTVAVAEVKDERREAIRKGFRIIADYIFGNNTAAQKVPMTAPVTQQGNEKIAMTAPVTQQAEGKTWRVRFIMPSKYTMETLPKPNNPAVAPKKIPSKRLVVIRFSGMAGEESFGRHTQELNDFLSAKNLAPLSPPTTTRPGRFLSFAAMKCWSR